MEPSQVIIEPARLREELRPGRSRDATPSASIPMPIRRRCARPWRRFSTSHSSRCTAQSSVKSEAQAARHLPSRSHALVEEGDRPGPRGRDDSDLRRAGRHSSLMAIRKPKPTSAGDALRVLSGLRRDHRDQAGALAGRGPRPRAAGATRSGARPRATAAAAPSASTARSTSSAARTASRRASRAIEYDPNRTAYIALLHYADGEKRYILAPARLTRRHDRRSRARTPTSRSATACRWRSMPTGTVVHNVELQPGRGGQLGALGRRRRSS